MSLCPKCISVLDPEGRCPVCHYRVKVPSRFKRIGLFLSGLVMSYALLGLLLWHYFKPELENFLGLITFSTPVYEVSIEPPASPVPRTNPVLSIEQYVYLQQLFEGRKFAELTEWLEALQEEFEADHLKEHLIVDAFAIFDLARPDYEPLLDAWVSEYPDHFPPYLARAQYRVEMGWESRGTDWARKTPEESFLDMRDRFKLALADLQKALTLNSRLLPAYRLLINIHNTQGEEYLENEAFARGKRISPDCYLLYSRMIWAKQPRWGGSFQEMEAIALQAYEHIEANSELITLFGYIYIEQAKIARSKGKYTKAINLCKKGLAFGQYPSFFRERGRTFESMGEWKKALVDYDASIALAPLAEETYNYRRHVRYQLGDYEGSLQDAFLAWQLAPQKQSLKEVYEWATTFQMELENEKNPKKIIEARPTANSLKMQPGSAIHIEEMFPAPPGTKPSGLTWQSGRLYLSSFSENPGVYVIDPENGRVMQRLLPEIVKMGWYGGLATDGIDIYHVQAREGRHAARLSGDELAVKKQFFFNCPEKQLTDIAVLNDSIYAIGTDDFMNRDGIKLMRFTLDGDLQEAFQYHHEVDKHAFNCGMTTDGRWLYVASWDKLIKVDPETGNIVEKYPLRLSNIFGLAWDGEAIWAASFLGPIYRITFN